MIKNEDLIGRVSKILLCTSFRNHVTKEHLIEVVEYFQATFYESDFRAKDKNMKTMSGMMNTQVLMRNVVLASRGRME